MALMRSFSASVKSGRKPIDESSCSRFEEAKADRHSMSDDTADTFRGVDVADEPRDAFFVLCADEDAAAGFLQEASDGFGLR